MNAGPAIGKCHPDFWNALRGIWLITWRTRLTWRRVPQILISLLALPILVYVTTLPPGSWTRRHSMIGDPLSEYRNFSIQLNRRKLHLNPQQQIDLRQVFMEEFSRGRDRLAAADPRGELGGTEQRKAYQVTLQRIRERLGTILNEDQMVQFTEFENRRLQQNELHGGAATWSRTDPFYHCLIDFYLFVIVPLLCVSACGALIREDVQANTLAFLTTRPLSRARLLIVKYLCQTAWLQLVMLFGAALLFAAGMIRQVPALGRLLPLFLAAQFLAVPAWSALGTLLGLISKRYLALALLYGFIVEMGIGRIPTNINTLSMLRHLKTLLAHEPELQRIYEWSGTGPLFSTAALVIGALIFLSAAVALFTFKEYHHTVEMQK